jgi:hypothetical protein
MNSRILTNLPQPNSHNSINLEKELIIQGLNVKNSHIKNQNIKSVLKSVLWNKITKYKIKKDIDKNRKLINHQLYLPLLDFLLKIFKQDITIEKKPIVITIRQGKPSNKVRLKLFK